MDVKICLSFKGKKPRLKVFKNGVLTRIYRWSYVRERNRGVNRILFFDFNIVDLHLEPLHETPAFLFYLLTVFHEVSQP